MSNIEVVSVSNKGDYVSYSKEPVNEYDIVEGEKLFSFSFVKDSHRKLIGKMLTIVDSSIENDRQCKAMKDLVRTAFNEELCFASEMGFDQDIIQKKIEDIPEEELEAVDIEEVLNS